MVNYAIYKLAYELMIESTVNHQKVREAHPYFIEIAKYLDNFFQTSDFNHIYKEKTEFYQNLLISEDESLFIQELHIPYLVKTDILCTLIDKLSAFIIIQGWVKEFNIPEELIYRKLASTLELDDSSSELIYNFINGSNTIESDENYLLLKPESNLKHEKLEGEWVEENKPDNGELAEVFFNDKLQFPLQTIFLKDCNGFLVKCKHETDISFYKNDYACPDKFSFILTGDSLSLNNEIILNFTDFKRKYVEKKYRNNFCLTALKADSGLHLNKRIKPFNFIGQPGELIGIVGREGSGKSSLLGMLAGVLKPQKGSVCINGYDIYKNSYQLAGFIGYVPEEDLLYHELSAKENLSIAAQLYLNKTLPHEINDIVDNLLTEMELWDIRNEKVGSPKEKRIQPCQRRLLNIALELIRDPYILIVDNAITSLSISDSSKVIEVLTKYTFKGKLIITSITQTSLKSFELFDKLFIIDQDGTPLYFGQRQEALSHLLNYMPEGISRPYLEIDNFSSEMLIDLINKKKISPKSIQEYTNYINSGLLYSNFLKQPVSQIERSRKRKIIPKKQAQTPRLERQYIIYCIRNFRTKIAQRKELYFTLFAAPVIGLILSIALRSSDGTTYSFSTNQNISFFFLISILAIFFFGLSLSVRDIIREKHVLQKEGHLTLSFFSYINSKITYFEIIIFFQTLIYTLIVNSILKIEGMLLSHWIIYFTTATFGTLLGLVYSSTHKSLDSILLKTLPLTLVFLLIFSGGYVPLKNLSSKNSRYTPLISDIMVTRWAYEAIMVDQFIANQYQQKINDAERAISVGSYNSFHVLPLLREYFEGNELNKTSDSADFLLNIIRTHFNYCSTTENIFPFEYTDKLIASEFNDNIRSEAQDYLAYLEYYFSKKYTEGLKKKAFITDSINSLSGYNTMEELKLKHYNNYIAQQVRNTSTRESYRIADGRIIQISDPVYQKPYNNFGRGQLFMSEKRFNNQTVNTLLFNISIIWMMNFILYILLITNLLNVFQHTR